MKKVGKDLVNTGKRFRKFSYNDVHFDEDGWADAAQFLPGDYDLAYLKLQGKPSVCGWSIGINWDGAKLEDGDKVLYWKRKPDQTE
jgi:hypothetical protein